MNPKLYNLAPVTKDDLAHALPDLYHSPILTLRQPEASLIALGALTHITASVDLPSRIAGHKLYLRAASLIDEDEMRRHIQADALIAALLSHAVTLRHAEKMNKKVTFYQFHIKKQTIPIPLDCLLGSCVPELVKHSQASPRTWHILRAISFATLYPIPSQGGIYYLRELKHRTQSTPNAPKGFP